MRASDRKQKPNLVASTITFEEDVLQRIGEIAVEAGVDAYAVGGYIRDKLLGKTGKDVDVVVVGDGIKFARQVARSLHVNPPIVYKNFGTAMLQIGDYKIEFVGARKESYARDSRKPVVESGTLEDDLSRRDFTINAIAAPLGKNGGTSAELLDPFGGRKDLELGIIRTPLDPEKTFDDDPLRLLRAIRFAAQLGFQIEKKTFAAIIRRKERLAIVSQERITEEFLKILESPKPSIGLKLMQDTGVMRIVFPEIAEMAGVAQRDEYHHKDVLLHSFRVVDNIAETTEKLWLRFAALVHDIAKPRTKAFKEGTGWTFHGHDEIGARMMKSIFQRMRLPFDYLNYVEKLIRLHLRPMALVGEAVTDSAVRRLLFEAGPDIDDLMLLCRADITSKNPKLVREFTRNYDIVAAKMKEVEERDRLRQFQPPVRGDEIMRVCGLEPGPLVGKLKKMIEEAILQGTIPNEHDAALDYLLKIKDGVLSKPA